MTGPIIGDLTLEAADGTVLSAANDLALAWKWAEHENGTGWAGMPYRARCASVADALAELRRAYGTAG